MAFRSHDLSQPQTVIDLLVGRGSYELARIYSKANNIATDSVTLKEVESKLAESRQSCLWLSPDTRVAIWSECSKLLKKRDCGNEVAGYFFLDKAESSADIDPPMSPKEAVTLMMLAQGWFNGSINHSDPVKNKNALEVSDVDLAS